MIIYDAISILIWWDACFISSNLDLVPAIEIILQIISDCTMYVLQSAQEIVNRNDYERICLHLYALRLPFRVSFSVVLSMRPNPISNYLRSYLCVSSP